MQPEDQQVIETIRRFIARDVAPLVETLEAQAAPPDALIEQMRGLGLFGLAVPEAYGGLALPVPMIAAILETIASGWTTLAAYLNSHATVCHLIATSGTAEQKAVYLPALAAGSLRGALSLTESEAGSDLQSIRTTARLSEGRYLLRGDKVFVTNGRSAGLFVVLVKTDPGAVPAHRGMSLMLVEKSDPGVTVGPSLSKMAYGLVDTCEVGFMDVAVPAARLLGVTGKGLGTLLSALELGRIMIAASAVGLAQSALEAALAYARIRRTFGKPIAEHQAVQLELAGMATRIEAARQLTLKAARDKQEQGRADLSAGMAKLFASETALAAATSALRIHGGYGFIKGQAVERLFREAPLYIVGEGTNEIQKLVIARRLLEGSV